MFWKRPPNWITAAGTLFWVLRLAMGSACPLQTGDETITQEREEKIFVARGTRIALLLSGKLSGKKNSPTPRVIAVQDLVIEGKKVIASGVAAQYNPQKKTPGRFNEPGMVGLEITGVTATSGIVIPLMAFPPSANGQPPCLEVDCMFLPFLFWMHGDAGQIDAGYLLNAVVKENVGIFRASLPSVSNAAYMPPVARIHLYPAILPQAESSESHANDPFPVGIYLDGKKVGILGKSEYACALTTPGPHLLRIDHEEFRFETGAGEERYIRATYFLPDSGSKIVVEETEGYELTVEFLKPGWFGRKGVPCFEPLGTISERRHARK